ncbi:MAG: hypothetical protein KGI78_00180, partial [Patescibacteria group bacterium]|nr:hypothetical protein [Patescibacteria group bacterium]
MARQLTSKRRKRLVLLDTHAIIHRAYHALPEFTGPDGRPTGALYGLVAMLIKMVNDLEPDYIAACYDLPVPTVRHEAYEAYKGTRAALDDALAEQIERSREVFKAFSIPVYEKPGFEADDLLGTIARETKGKVDVVIASGDMDTLQLVDDDRVRVYTLKKGLNDTILYDEEKVEERFGFGPALIPDLKSIMGDPSDNIKGVPGVGEGSALKLVASYGALEKLLAALKKKGGVEAVAAKAGIQKRYAQLVLDHEEDARFSKALATIRTDAPIAFAIPATPWQEHADLVAILALLDSMGFRSLRDRAKKALGAAAGEEPGESASEDEADERAVAKRPAIAPERLAEAKAMLWLISSDFTNPSLDDILAFTKQSEFDAAYAALEAEIAKLGRVREVYEAIEKPLVPVIARMEARGVLVDPAILARLAHEYARELAKIEEAIFKAAGHPFNISSPKQMGVVLFDELGLVPDRQKRTAGGQRSTRESELEKIRELHPIVGDILEYRELKKLLSTYIENLPPLLDSEHRLHAEFIQTGTSTGRLASASPNLQNIPLHSARGQAIRHAFVAPPGFALVALDYSQIELRLAAILSGDEKLCDIFRAGRDVHREVAAMVFSVAPEAVDR